MPVEVPGSSEGLGRTFGAVFGNEGAIGELDSDQLGMVPGAGNANPIKPLRSKSQLANDPLGDSKVHGGR
jgi:hypothetical protein